MWILSSGWTTPRGQLPRYLSGMREGGYFCGLEQPQPLVKSPRDFQFHIQKLRTGQQNIGTTLYDARLRKILRTGVDYFQVLRKNQVLYKNRTNCSFMISFHFMVSLSYNDVFGVERSG